MHPKSWSWRLCCNHTIRGIILTRNRLTIQKRTSVISERIIAGNENNTTNNRMELTATVRALESLKDSKTKIRLYTDSKVMMLCRFV